MAFTAKTTNQASVWSPDLHSFAFEDAVPEALINQLTTVVGTIEGDRPSLTIGYVTDAGASFIDEGAEFAETEPVLAEAECTTQKIGQLIRLSRELYLQKQTPESLSQSVARALTKKLDEYLLAQAAPTAPAVRPQAGLFNTAGLSSVTGVADNLDKLVDLQVTVAAAGANPTAWVLSPQAWGTLRKLKTTADSNMPILAGTATDTTKLLLGLPVVVSNALGAKQGLLVSKTEIFSAVSQVEVSTDHSAYFTSQGVGVLGSARVGWVIPRPARIGKLTLA